MQTNYIRASYLQTFNFITGIYLLFPWNCQLWKREQGHRHQACLQMAVRSLALLGGGLLAFKARAAN